MNSHAFPTRICTYRTEDGDMRLELAGSELVRGTLVQVQLDDETWLTGLLDWDQPSYDFSYDLSKPPLLTVFLRPGGLPSGAEEPLTASMYLPRDAVVRRHARWLRLNSTRPKRPPGASRRKR